MDQTSFNGLHYYVGKVIIIQYSSGNIEYDLQITYYNNFAKLIGEVVMAIPEIALKRLQSDYIQLLSKPVDYISAHPLEDNILEWHYVIRGPQECPFYDGIYHGNLKFPKEFPLKPPSIYMFTPNGRFECNVRLCLTMSDYHPETWSPLWTVAAVLTGLLSFMLEKTKENFIGCQHRSDDEKKKLAQQSWSFNLKNEIFCQYFPELAQEAKTKTK